MRISVTLLGAALSVMVLASGVTASEPVLPEVPETEAIDDVYTDACFGDRYESDADLNEGSEISEQDLIDLMRALNGPGV